MGEQYFTVRDSVPYFTLSPDETQRVVDAVKFVSPMGTVSSADDFVYLAALTQRLPERLFEAVQRFRITGRPYGGFVLSGLPIDDAALGPTPLSYSDETQSLGAQAADLLLLLIGSLLGHPFSFATQQRGKLVLDVFPVAGHEDQQLGSSSTACLEWHNEDAFHDHRADWITLLCLRNKHEVATMYAPVHELELSPEGRENLFGERFVILPDESHTSAFNKATTGVDDGNDVESAFDKVARMASEPDRIAILSGDPAAPFVRIDQAYLQRDLGDPLAEAALAEVIIAIEDKMVDLVLRPGDLLVVDNRRAVHGRKPFVAHYDGSDRWLKRVNLTANLRPTEGMRSGTHGRALA